MSQIGHTLGMLHEQCRWDRDEYLEYRCQNLVGYEAAIAAAEAEGIPRNKAENYLCNNKAFADHFNFAGSQYVKNDKFDNLDFGPMDYGAFDYGSIMMYPSSAYAGDSRCWEDSTMDLCPMIAQNGWMIVEAPAPSNGDIAFVKKWYA